MKPNDATIYSKSGWLLKVDVTTSWVLVEIDETQKRKLWSLPTHLSSGNSWLLNHVTIKKPIQIHLSMTAAKERNPPIKFRMTSHAGTWVSSHARRSSNITASTKFLTNWSNIITSKVERNVLHLGHHGYYKDGGHTEQGLSTAVRLPELDQLVDLRIVSSHYKHREKDAQYKVDGVRVDDDVVDVRLPVQGDVAQSTFI